MKHMREYSQRNVRELTIRIILIVSALTFCWEYSLICTPSIMLQLQFSAAYEGYLKLQRPAMSQPNKAFTWHANNVPISFHTMQEVGRTYYM